MERADVVVVGAGPAGSAAATTLARAGLDVVVVDKARAGRDKTCGDGLTTGALRLLERLGLDPTAVPSWQTVEQVFLRSPVGREIGFPLPQGQGSYAVVARRAELDAALLDLARCAGAKVLDGNACRGALEGADRVVVGVEHAGPIHARYAIGADGMWSALRKHLGLGIPAYRGDWHAFRQYFAGVGARAGAGFFVWFEPDLLPGYAWSFPLPGARANVGFGIPLGAARRGHNRLGSRPGSRDYPGLEPGLEPGPEPGPGLADHPEGGWRGHPEGGAGRRAKDMAALWPELLARPHVRDLLGPAARPEGTLRAWPIPARIGAVPLAGRRTLFVGDAAAAADPMTGEGIGQALLTGILAAESLVATGPQPGAGAAQRYSRAARAALVADHRMSALLVRALRNRRAAAAALTAAGATDWTRRNFARWLVEDYPRAALATPRRWRRAMFTGRGSY